MANSEYAAWQYERWARFHRAAATLGRAVLDDERPAHVGLFREDGFDLVASNLGRVAIIRSRGFGDKLVTKEAVNDQGN